MIYLTILRKELKDYLRDKKSLIMMFLPVIIFPLLFGMMNHEIEKTKDTEILPITVALYSDNEKNNEIINTLFQFTEFIKPVDDDVNNRIDLLQKGTVLLIFKCANNEGIELIYNANSTKSLAALNITENLIDSIKQSYIEQELLSSGKSLDYLQKYTLTKSDLSVYTENGNSLLSTLAPMLLIMFIVNGGSALAVDIFVGEKERKTIENLLSTQANRIQLYSAKFTTVLLFSLLNTIISVIGYIISFSFNDNLKVIYGSMSNTSLSVITQVIFICIIFAALSSSILCLLSITAKNTREAQTRNALFTMIPIILGGISMYLDASEINSFTSFIPIYNVVAAIKFAFSNILTESFFLGYFLSSLFLIFILFVINYKIINSEKIIHL